MKRSHPQGEPVEPKDDAEMDVDDEEKAETEAMIQHDDDTDDTDMDDETPVEEPAAPVENSFMDSFYGISSTSAAERAHSAQVMLHHSLVGPDANVKDASYALRRLLNGICSGRAAARQGNASALASFLKICISLGKMAEIKEETQKDEEKDLTELAFVRCRLLAATEPGEGRKKGSEERDCQFGRLFGINGIVKSGILLPKKESEVEDLQSVTNELVSDLAKLYQAKQWLREPAAHAVCTLLNSLYTECPDSADAQKVVENVVENVVVPELLTNGDNVANAESSVLFATYSAEQIGIAVNIQSQVHLHSNPLPPPIDKAVLTKETMPLLSLALFETSVVTQPRTHLVWDTLWAFISKAEDSIDRKSAIRKTRKVCPISNESVDDLLRAVLQNVVIDRLLGVKKDDGAKSTGKTTHERQALALCIVRNLTSAEFISSISGRTRLFLEPEMLESLVFSPVFVKLLFLNVICAKPAGKGQPMHTLKSLSEVVLQAATESLVESDGVDTLEQSLNKRLGVAKALLRCDSSFDSKTKMTAANALLGLNGAFDESEGDSLARLVWEPYMLFLEQRIVSTTPTDPAQSSHEAQGYIDLLFRLGKRMCQSDSSDGARVLEFKASAVKRIFGFLITIAFFDCKDAKGDDAPKSKKKKRKSSSNQDTTVNAATTAVKFGAGTSCPYDMRQVASARFYSLVSDCVSTTAHSSKQDKLSSILDVLTYLHDVQKQLVAIGAKRFADLRSVDEMDTDMDDSPDEIVATIRKEADNCKTSDSDDKESSARKRWTVSCAILATTLNLHLLSYRQPDEAQNSEVVDTDEDENFEEITSYLSDLHHVASLFTKDSSAEVKPLAALAELCASVLSSSVGIGNWSLGASATLLRDIVRLAWYGGLNLAAAAESSEDSALDASVVNIILNAVGAIGDSPEEEREEDSDEKEDSDDDKSSADSDSDSAGEAVFTLATGIDEFSRDKEMSEKPNEPLDEAEESDLELDPSKLQSMLEEGSDFSIDGANLEHHEGADGALAKLIQMKQDARKVGQLARERSEIARQNRCTLLLETLVIGRAETYGALLRVDLVLQIILPILQYRKDLLKSLGKATTKGSAAGISEKRNLLNRLTALLKSKILKTKVPDTKWTDSANVKEFAQDFGNKVLECAMASDDEEHQELCNASLIFMLRNVQVTETKLELSELYASAVLEWSTKQTTRLNSTFLERLIVGYPIVAQACLVVPLASAASDARKDYLKSEAWRMLGLLYNPKLNSNESDLEKIALQRITEAADAVYAALSSCLQDSSMKTKWVREVLKTAEKISEFLLALPSAISVRKERLNEIFGLLEKIKDGDSQSQPLKDSAEKLMGDIDNISKKVDESSKMGSAKKSKKKSKKKKR